MSSPVRTQLGTFTAAGLGIAVVSQQGDHTFSATVAGSGAVNASVSVQASNDLVGWVTIASLSPSGTASASAAAPVTVSYSYWRANVLSVTAGAVLTVAAASEEAAGAGSGSGLASVQVASLTAQQAQEYHPAALFPALPLGDAIAATAIALNIIGGGVIRLPRQSIALTAPLPLYKNVQYLGNGYRLDSNEFASEGTILVGNGTFAAFEYNTADLGSPLANNAAFLAQFISNVVISDLAMTNFTYGIRAGGLYNPSLWHARLENLHIQSCSEWGVYLENFVTCQITNIYTQSCGHSQAYIQSGTANLDCGNSNLTRILSQNPTKNGCGRGIVVGSRGASGCNNMVMHDFLSVGLTTTSTQACTMTNGQATFGVTDLSKFGVGMPVTFIGADVNNFYTGYIYFVTSVSGTGGAGTISVCDGNTWTPVVANGSAAISVKTNGWPGLQLGALDSASNGIAFSSLTGATDVEASGTARIVLRKTVSCLWQFGIIGFGASLYHLATRQCTSTTVLTNQTGLAFDLGDVNQSVQFFGVAPATLAGGNRIRGCFNDRTYLIPLFTPPPFQAGGMYFDGNTSKMKIGGAAGWETITSA